MPSRLYLSPIVQINLNGRTPFASKVLEYVRKPGITSIMPNPYRNWCLTYCRDITNTEHNLIDADSEIREIPFSALDLTVSELTSNQRTAIQNWLENNQIPIDWITGSTTIRELLRFIIRFAHLIQILKNDFPSELLDATVSDIPNARRQRMLNWAQANNIDTSGITLLTPIRVVLRHLINNYGWSIIHDMPFLRGN